MSYTQSLTDAMTMLSEQPDTVFVGQNVKYDGQAAHKTFSGVPDEKKIEFPVAEEFQMGFCAGLAMEGYLPISFYPRIDFLILAMNQLVNHLDKMGQKVIIRTAVGSTHPLNPGPQHIQDHTWSISRMLTTVNVVRLKNAQDVAREYAKALESKQSTILVEYMGNYN